MTAYADFLRFGQLPYAGGSFQQPAELLEEMRTVHGAFSREKERLEKAAARKRR